MAKPNASETQKKPRPKPISKAVIAAAGFGTRLLPATKSQPKEMLTVIDKPIIHYLVEELVSSGIKDIIIVTNDRQRQKVIEDYFNPDTKLERFLSSRGKKEVLEAIKNISQMANITYVRQDEGLPYGNATPLLATKDLISPDEAFVYMFGDDLAKSEVPATKQITNTYRKINPAAVLAVQKMPWQDIHLVASIKYENGTKINQVAALIEKADEKHAYSNLGQFGRFVFSYKVIDEIQQTPLGLGNELWLTDALNRLAQKDVVIAQPIEGECLTTGDPLHYLKAIVGFALEREDINPSFRDYLRTLPFNKTAN